jgi:hypothetical protein
MAGMYAFRAAAAGWGVYCRQAYNTPVANNRKDILGPTFENGSCGHKLLDRSVYDRD